MDGAINVMPVDIIYPTPEEAADGLKRVEECIGYWMTTPGLLVIKPDYGLIVSMTDLEHDSLGFRIRVAIKEKLVAPAEEDRTELVLSCVWNQPYLFFARDGISALYSFSLFFGAEGVARARKVPEKLADGSEDSSDRSQWLLTRMEHCFDPD